MTRQRVIKLFYFLGACLFVLMMYSPRSNIGIKVFFLIPVLGAILIGMIMGLFSRTSIIIEIWFMLFISFGGVWCLLGYINGNAGTNDYFRLYIIWVFIYYFLQTPLAGLKGGYFIYRCSQIAVFMICAYSLVSILTFIGEFPDTFVTQMDMGMKIGIHEGYVQLLAHNVGSLMFLVPMLFCVVLNQDDKSILERFVNRVLLVISIIVVILTGRRALLFVVIVSPLLSWLIWKLVSHDVSKKIGKRVRNSYLGLFFSGIFAFWLLAQYTQWDSEEFVRRILNVFVDDGGVRIEQGRALLDGFFDSPIWGHGFGAGVYNVIRDPEKPWQYELSYHLLLNNLGIVGFLFWVAAVLFPMVYGIRVLRKNRRMQSIMVPLIVGEVAFLMANATNPYLLSFDFMFVLFVVFPALKPEITNLSDA